MYKKSWLYGRHFANPLNPEASDVLRRRNDELPYEREKRLQVIAAVVLVCLGLVAATLGITVPEEWPWNPGMNDILGIAGMLVLDIVAFCCVCYDWVAGIGVRRVIARFGELESAEEIVEVPVVIYDDLERALWERGLFTFFTTSYEASPQDFEIVKQTAGVDKTGTLDNETRTRIKALIDQILTRITQAYEDAQADQNGRLSSLCELRLLEEG